jgi:hypothetical protein
MTDTEPRNASPSLPEWLRLHQDVCEVLERGNPLV